MKLVSGPSLNSANVSVRIVNQKPIIGKQRISYSLNIGLPTKLAKQNSYR